MRTIFTVLFLSNSIFAQHTMYVCGSISKGFVVGKKLEPSGLYIRNEAGGQPDFRHVGFTHPYLVTVASAPGDAATLYAAAGNGVIRMTAAGEHWRILTDWRHTEFQEVAVEAGAPVVLEAATTIADGIAVRRAGDRTLPLVSKYVDEIVTVGEEEIASAILLLLESEKTIAEGAGAAALAAMLHHKIGLAGRRVAVLVCGGNIDVTLLSRIIERGLKKDGRLIRLRIHLPDHPGSLVRVAAIIAEHKANIVQTMHDRSHYGVSISDTVIDIQMETRGPEHEAELCHALHEAGYENEEVT